MKVINENTINQAIADFDGVKRGLEYQYIPVPEGTPTSDYEHLIMSIGNDIALAYIAAAARGATMPAMQNSDNLPDTILSIPEPSGLPHGFFPLDYLQSTKTQVIDTGFIPTLGQHTIECEFELPEDNQSSSMFAARTNSGVTPAPARAGNWYFISRNRPSVYVGTTSNVTTLPSDLQLHTRYTVRVEFNDSAKTVKRSLTGYSDANATYSGTIKTLDSLTFFGARTEGNYAEFGAFRIYSFKIWEDGELVRDLVPCFNVNIGRPCMYCRITAQPYYNARAGADFLYGV